MQTTGQYRVMGTLDPSNNATVDEIKAMAAALIDRIVAIAPPQVKDPTLENEIARCKALAITHVEDAAMWAVKAATKPPKE